MAKIKIVSNGNPMDTNVYHDGKLMDNVMKIEFNMAADDITAEVKLTILNVELDINVDEDNVKTDHKTIRLDKDVFLNRLKSMEA